MSKEIADATWRRGFVHLTVDGNGLVSLWDDEKASDSYLRLPLTDEQKRMIQDTMNREGDTP